MNFFRNSLFTIVLISVVFALAAPESGPGHEYDFLQALDYPELQVVPRASEKVFLESQFEKDAGWSITWPFQVSAGATLVSGLLLNGKYKESFGDSEKSDMDFATKASVGVGVVWMGLTYYLFQQQPYGTEAVKLRKIVGKDKRNDLLRERMAEEAMERPARIMRIATWASVITNLAVNAAVVGRTDRDNSIYPALGIVTSILPLIFQNRYIENYEKQLEYKRKIYAPIASINPVQTQADGSGRLIFAPQAVLTWNY